MEESNLGLDVSNQIGTKTHPIVSRMAVPLVESTTTNVGTAVANATTKAAAIIDGLATPGVQSPVSADSLIDEEQLSASASEPMPTTATPPASSAGGKPQRKYERKTKRFVWPDELHRLFVASIFDLGLKHASPKALMPFMANAAGTYGLTTEHLKSHLQKYRLNYERSRVEFLEFYDETAQRNQKRRRRSGGRATASSSEHNTMFVFPIRAHGASSNANPDAGEAEKKAENHYEEDEDEDMDEEDEVDSAHEDTRVRGRLSQSSNSMPSRRQADTPPTNHAASSLQHPSSAQLYYQQLLQQAHAAGALSTPNPRLPPSRSKSPQHLVELAQQYAAHGLPFPGAAGGNMYDSTAAATAAAAAAAATAAANGAPLTDPQWSILASLLSPHLTAATAAAAAAGHHQRSRSMADDTFMLDAEPSDLQMQMHLAMQAQMNLHRQMLNRKVAVSQNAYRGQQHLNDRGSISHFPPSALSDVQQQHQQQWAAAAMDHIPPAHAMRLQLLQQQQPHFQPNAHRNPAPSFQQQLHAQSYGFPPASGSMPPSSSAPTSQAPVSNAMPPTASSSPPHSASTNSTAVTMSATQSAAASSTISRGANAAAPPTRLALTLTPGLGAMPAPGDVPMNPLEAYRWDQMDLQMNLDEEEEGDLFGFLRS